jgi:uncharacterized repeat protein (TIGR03847 family)
MSTSFELDAVDRFVVGTIGMPGSRTFYFQVSAPKVILSFKCEKVQVAALRDALERMLADLPAVAKDSPDASWAPLDLPVLAEWTVGSIGIGYEADSDRLVVVLEELVAGDSDDGSQARFFLTRSQAALFASRAAHVVSAGRPMCPVCGSAIDPDGYNCACFN